MLITLQLQQPPLQEVTLSGVGGRQVRENGTTSGLGASYLGESPSFVIQAFGRTARRDLDLWVWASVINAPVGQAARTLFKPISSGTDPRALKRCWHLMSAADHTA